MDFPGSPFFVLERLLEEYHQGLRSPENVSESLDRFDQFVEQCHQGLLGLPLDSKVLPEGERQVEESFQCLSWFGEAGSLMREYLECGDESLADQALALARAGHEQLGQLFLRIHKQVEELQNEVG